MKKNCFLPLSVFLITSCGKSPTPPTPPTPVDVFYEISSLDTDHLAFLTLDGEALNHVKVKANAAFSFQIIVNNVTSKTEYKVPGDLSLTIDDTEISIEHYHFHYADDYQSAVVDIDEGIINGNLLITGDALKINHYRYKIIAHYGFDVREDLEGELVSGDPLVLHFIKKETSLPNRDNIWYFSMAGITPRVPTEAQYQNGVLTLPTSRVTSYLQIVARSPDYQLLDEISWSEVNDISKKDLAPYLFYLGEEKHISLGHTDLHHEVRIIGFNHDTQKDKTKVGITFEFAQLPTIYNEDIQKYQSLKCAYDQIDVSSFPNSVLHTYINGVFPIYINDLDLIPYVKNVQKKVLTGSPAKTITEYTTKFFPLSTSELNAAKGDVSEGNPYQYYIDHPSPADRVKTSSEETESGTSYWTRSPVKGGTTSASLVIGSGELKNMDNKEERSFAPAFCI